LVVQNHFHTFVSSVRDELGHPQASQTFSRKLTILIELNGNPNSELVVKIGKSYVAVLYDRKGYLRLIREAKKGQNPLRKPKKDETVFRVTNFLNGESTYKSSGSHSGFFSVNGQVYWSTIWDDAGPSEFKKCSFRDWVIECAQVLASAKKKYR